MTGSGKGRQRLSNSQETSGFQPRGATGLPGVLALPDFRRLWIGQIFSQLADKFYIVLMVYLIAQTWVGSTPEANPALAEAASAMRLELPENRAQMITLLATGI